MPTPEVSEDLATQFAIERRNWDTALAFIHGWHEAKIKKLQTHLDLSFNGNRFLPFSEEQLGFFLQQAWNRYQQESGKPARSKITSYSELEPYYKKANDYVASQIARWTLMGDSAARSFQFEGIDDD
jgi:hypothetical protein